MAIAAHHALTKTTQKLLLFERRKPRNGKTNNCVAIHSTHALQQHQERLPSETHAPYLNKSPTAS